MTGYRRFSDVVKADNGAPLQPKPVPSIADGSAPYRKFLDTGVATMATTATLSMSLPQSGPSVARVAIVAGVPSQNYDTPAPETTSHRFTLSIAAGRSLRVQRVTTAMHQSRGVAGATGNNSNCEIDRRRSLATSSARLVASTVVMSAMNADSEARIRFAAVGPSTPKVSESSSASHLQNPYF
jgi:hypothetical protein